MLYLETFDSNGNELNETHGGFETFRDAEMRLIELAFTYKYSKIRIVNMELEYPILSSWVKGNDNGLRVLPLHSTMH